MKSDLLDAASSALIHVNNALNDLDLCEARYVGPSRENLGRARASLQTVIRRHTGIAHPGRLCAAEDTNANKTAAARSASAARAATKRWGA